MFEKSAKTVFFIFTVFMIAGCISAAEVRYENGCKVEGDYKNGLKNGVWIFYNAAGKKVRQETYQDGVFHGKFCQWDDDGFLLSETAWQSGKRHGKSVTYWITGAVRSEGTFHEGNGKLTGWYPSGKKQFEEEYINDKQIGKQISWGENGQKSLEYTNNEAGKYEGSFIYFQKNGQKAYELEYKNGMILKVIEFDAHGNKTREDICEPVYENGKLIEGKLRGVGMSIGLELYYDPTLKQYMAEMPFAGGDPCVYMDIPGTAKITAIKPAKAGLNNCPRHPVEVLFDFTPDDPKRLSKYAHDRHMTVGAGMNPSLDFVENRGLKAGQTLRCIRKEIVTGTCSPTGFDFQDINLSDYAKWCF